MSDVLPDAHTCIYRWLPSGSCDPWVQKFPPDKPQLEKYISIEKHKFTLFKTTKFLEKTKKIKKYVLVLI